MEKDIEEMMNIAKYKRLNASIPDVATKTFKNISFSSSIKDGVI